MLCRVGLTDSYTSRHFRDHHNEIWKSHGKELKAYTGGWRLTSTDELKHPEEAREPVPGLEIKNGFACTEEHCRYVCITKKVMQRHCRERHGRQTSQAYEWFPCKLQTLLGKPNTRYVMIVPTISMMNTTLIYVMIDILLSRLRRVLWRIVIMYLVRCHNSSSQLELKNRIHANQSSPRLTKTFFLYELLGCNEPSG